jgi:hypothetical protein
MIADNLSVSFSSAPVVVMVGANPAALLPQTVEGSLMKNRSAGLAIAGLLVWVSFLNLPYSYAATFETQGGDKSSKKTKQGVIRPIIVPVGIKVRGARPEEIRSVDFNVTEDGDAQNLVSVRYDSPLYLTILIQDDLVSTVSLEIKAIKEFILNLPKGTRVMIGCIRSGSLDVRQKFTSDLEKAAKTLRSPSPAAVRRLCPQSYVVAGTQPLRCAAGKSARDVTYSDGQDA